MGQTGIYFLARFLMENEIKTIYPYFNVFGSLGCHCMEFKTWLSILLKYITLWTSAPLLYSYIFVFISKYHLALEDNFYNYSRRQVWIGTVFCVDIFQTIKRIHSRWRFAFSGIINFSKMNFMWRRLYNMIDLAIHFESSNIA